MKPLNLTGKIFCRLTVKKYFGSLQTGNRTVRAWLCYCSCGKKDVVVRGQALTCGNTKSCGCLNNDSRRSRINEAAIKHGHARRFKVTTEYWIWLGMKRRCVNKNDRAFKYYGGRGIKVCDRWMSSFSNFLADMGRRPKKHSIDRWPNNNGNYEPGNVRWATARQQQLNRSDRTKSA